MSGETRWLTLRAAAADLGKSERTLRRWRDEHGAGAIAGLWKPGTGKRKLVDVEMLQRWAEAKGLMDREPDGGGRSEQAEAEPAPDPAAIEAEAKRRALEEDKAALRRMLAAGDDPDKLLALNPEDVRRIQRVVRLRKDLAEVERKERENAKASADLVLMADVRAWFGQQVQGVHAAFRAAPGAWAPLLVDTDYEHAYEVLERELRHVLESLASEVPPL